jgi:hypothetical protein
MPLQLPRHDFNPTLTPPPSSHAQHPAHTPATFMTQCGQDTVAAGAAVELVISLTCDFGRTDSTSMELVLDRARVQGAPCCSAMHSCACGV